MTKYQLIPCHDIRLKTETQRFDFSNPPIDPVELACDLAEVMLENGGIGLAANQVGLPYSVFVLRTEEILPCFNPKVVDISEEEVYLEEGCLSFPGMTVKVKRPKTIKLRFTEPNGETSTRVFSGVTARAILHEMDHLFGINFLQRANKIHLEQARNRAKKTLRQAKKVNK